MSGDIPKVRRWKWEGSSIDHSRGLQDQERRTAVNHPNKGGQVEPELLWLINCSRSPSLELWPLVLKYLIWSILCGFTCKCVWTEFLVCALSRSSYLWCELTLRQMLVNKLKKLFLPPLWNMTVTKYWGHFTPYTPFCFCTFKVSVFLQVFLPVECFFCSNSSDLCWLSEHLKNWNNFCNTFQGQTS